MSSLHSAFEQAWPPFALIAGLLLIGLLAYRDGLFDWGGGWLQRAPGAGATLMLAAMALVALVTAVLNLDTAVVFLTPVLVIAARQRQLDPEPFVYGSVFMANASSLFLPGSNLTNLVVLGHQPAISGSSFALQMLPIAATAALVTALGLALTFRRELVGRGGGSAASPGRAGISLGAVATVLATALVLFTRQPAVPVLAVGVLATAIEVGRRRLTFQEVRKMLGPGSLLAALALTVLLGTLARDWDGPARLLDGATGAETAAIAAATTVLINNLPAAALYSAHAVHHTRMLLLGLNVGPNLAATGALSALLWFRSASAVGERPSLTKFTYRGVPLAVAAITAAILVQML